MKTVCIIDMVVLVCLIQILIGSSYGLPSTLLGNQSRNNMLSRKLATVHITVTFTQPLTIENETTIETNATTEERILITISSTTENGTRLETNVPTEEGTLITIPSITERGARVTSSPTTTPAPIPKTLDPYCPPKHCLSHTTYKCELHYEWVIHEKKWLRDSRLVDIQTPKLNSSVVVLARLVDANGNKYPCYVLIDNFEQVPSFNCFTVYPQNFEILLVNCGYYGWIEPLNGTVPENAIVGGKKGNEMIYICRFDTYYIGWMQPSTGLCNVYDDPPYAGKQHYELLVYLN